MSSSTFLHGLTERLATFAIVFVSATAAASFVPPLSGTIGSFEGLPSRIAGAFVSFDPGLCLALASSIVCVAAGVLAAFVVDNILFFDLPLSSAIDQLDGGGLDAAGVDRTLATNPVLKRGWARLKRDSARTGRTGASGRHVGDFIHLRSSTLRFTSAITSHLPLCFAAVGIGLTLVGLALSLRAADAAILGVVGSSAVQSVSDTVVSALFAQVARSLPSELATGAAGIFSSLVLSLSFRLLHVRNVQRIERAADHVADHAGRVVCGADTAVAAPTATGGSLADELETAARSLLAAADQLRRASASTQTEDVAIRNRAA